MHNGIRQTTNTINALSNKRYLRTLCRPRSDACFTCATISSLTQGSGVPGLVDRVFALHAGSRGFNSHRRHLSKRFFRSSRPGYLHLVCSELENSHIRVMQCHVGDGVCLIKPAKLYLCTQKHYKHNEDRCTALDVCGHGSLSHLGNVITRIGLQQLTQRPGKFAKVVC